MSHRNIIRAWNEETCWLSRSEAAGAPLPENLAELRELMDQIAIRSGALTTPLVSGSRARGHRSTALLHRCDQPSPALSCNFSASEEITN
jgi:hypothetical protein